MSSATSTKGVGAVVADVEARLRDIWLPTPGEPTKARACTMNLVVVGAPEIIERYQPVVDEVTSSIPARAILLSLDTEAASSLDADVSAVCGIGADATCSERITLRVGGAICARSASIVDALRVPEMPTALVWLGRVHVDDPVFAGLASDATRVVLDTEYTSLHSLLSLARWARARATDRGAPRSSSAPGLRTASLPPGADSPHVADLAWTRLAPWQEMLARFFDDPRLTEHSGHVRRIELRQASEPGARLGSELTLLLGFVATRLGWKMVRTGGRLRLSTANGGAIQLVLAAQPKPAAVAPSALLAVHVEAEREGVVLRGTVERDPTESDVLVWRLSADGVPCATEQRVRLGANKGARLLERTLHRAPHDAALMESARFAEDLGEEGLVCS